MAKLNYHKLNQQSKAQSVKERHNVASYLNFDDDGIWSLRGKYYGIHKSKLPNDYLFWILDNHSTGKFRGIAENEIYKRFHELSNT